MLRMKPNPDFKETRLQIKDNIIYLHFSTPNMSIKI